MGTTSEQVIDVEERTWLPRYCRGEKGCFAKLVQAYRRPIYNYLVRCGFDKIQSDDLFQDIFMKIHMAADSYQANKPLKPWLFTIATNTIRNHWRSQKSRPSIDHDIEVDTFNTTLDLPENLVDYEKICSWLELAIHKLPAAQAEVFVLFCIEHFAQSEIAEILYLPLNTVKTHLRRARQSLLLAYRANHFE